METAAAVVDIAELCFGGLNEDTPLGAEGQVISEDSGSGKAVLAPTGWPEYRVSSELRYPTRSV